MRQAKLFEICLEKGYEFVDGNEIKLIVKVKMPRAFDNEKFFRFSRFCIGIFGKWAGMGIFSHDEKHRTGRNRFNIIERIEIHKFNVASHVRTGIYFKRLTVRNKFASAMIKSMGILAGRGGIFINGKRRSAYENLLPAKKVGIALFSRLDNNFFTLF